MPLIENTAATLTAGGGVWGGVELLKTVKNATGQVGGNSPFAPAALEIFQDLTHVQENLKLENWGFGDVTLVVAGLFILQRGTAALLSSEAKPLAKIIGAGLFAVGAGATFLAPAVLETINKGLSAGGLETTLLIAPIIVAVAGIQWLMQAINTSNFSGEYSGRTNSNNTATPEELAQQAIKRNEKENIRLSNRAASNKTRIPTLVIENRIDNKSFVDQIIANLEKIMEKKGKDQDDLDERRRNG